MKKQTKWEETGYGNLILSSNWGRISYNPNTKIGHGNNAITELGNMILGEEKLTDGEETALYANGDWMILTGDFRKEYEKVFPDLNKCKEIYDKNKEKSGNAWSTA